jgi:hypothetical protein
MNERSAGTEHKWKWRRDLTIAVVGGLIVAWTTPRLGEQEIDPDLAYEFLTDYYTEVVEPNSRDEAWRKPAPEFQTQYRKVGGRKGYEDFWNTVRQVNVADVVPQDRKNEFRARKIYIRANSQSQRIDTTYRLKCIPWYQRLPSLTCKQEHIRIRDAFGTTYP